ncbi:MAG: fucose isomerase [Bacilli bacterium]|jgi:L-fucose isomerase-like protein|nr:fucose isomerase [Bacilli bacterium]
MRKARIGVVCLCRKTFDYITAWKLFQERIEETKKDDSVEWEVFSKPVYEPLEGEEAASFLLESKVDAVVLVSATFHLGHLALIIDKRVNKPILLWGFNELPYDGGKIRLNAVCGVNLNASNLYKSGNTTYIVHVGDEIDKDFILAIKMKVAIENASIGLIGYRAQGFFNVGVDELHLFHETGTLISHYELSALFGGEAKEEDIQREKAFVLKTFDTSKVNEQQVNLLAKLIVLASDFMLKEKLDVIAIRCWPEFAKTYGISPCAMMSVLQSRGMLLACEGDVEAALSMLAVKAGGEKTPFMADLSQVNYQENYALLWHDGVAPCNLWDGKCVRGLETYFAGGRGVTADFVLKEGKMSIMRIDTALGKTRLFYAEGEAVPMKKELAGTYAKVIFDIPVDKLIDIVTYTGVAHHVIMGYTQYRKAVHYLARIKGWELIDENTKV